MADGSINLKINVDTKQVNDEIKKTIESLQQFGNISNEVPIKLMKDILTATEELNKVLQESAFENFVKEANNAMTTLINLADIQKSLISIWDSSSVQYVRYLGLIVKEEAINIANTISKQGSIAATALEMQSEIMASKATDLATLSTQGNTVAVGLQTVAMNIGAVAASAFAAAVSFITSPLGIATVAIGAIIAGLLLFGDGLGAVGEEISAVEEKQKMLNQMFDESKIYAENCETSYTKLADEVLPKLGESWSELRASLLKYDMTSNVNQLQDLAENTKRYIGTIKDAMGTYYDDVYIGMMNHYQETGTLEDEKNQEKLKKLAEIQQEKLQVVDEHEKELLKLQDKLAEKGELSKEEQEQYREHLYALNQIAVETITPEQARQIAEQEAFLLNKGKLNHDEQERFAESLRNSEAEQLTILQTSYGQKLADCDNMYKQLIENAEGDQTKIEELMKEHKEEKRQITEAMNAEIETNQDEHYRKLILGTTGYTVEEVAEYKAMAAERDQLNAQINTMQAGAEQQRLRNQRDALEEEMGGLKVRNADFEALNKAMNDEGNKSYKKLWDAQLEVTKKGREDIKKEYTGLSQDVKKEGADKISSSSSDFEKAGTDVANGVAQGVKEGKDGAVSQVGSLAGEMLRKMKEAFGIASPSKVMRKLLRWVPIGGALGIADEADTLIGATTNMMEEAIDSATDLTSKFAEVGSEAVAQLADGLQEGSILEKEVALDINGTVGNTFTKFADAITKGIDTLVNTPLQVDEIGAIPSLPVNGIVNIPQASVPFQNHMLVNNDMSDIKAVLENLVLQQETTGNREMQMQLSIDGERLFTWINKKKREHEFITNGGEY